MATTILKALSGKEYEMDTATVKQLENEAIQAYNDSIEYDRLTRGKSEMKKWQMEVQMQKAGKLKFGTVFQVAKKELVISYKQNLLNGLFKGHTFQMQTIKPLGSAPAGEIFKW
jgi:FKBP-type peptidyl-prolyl cis-trans isomerase